MNIKIPSKQTTKNPSRNTKRNSTLIIIHQKSSRLRVKINNMMSITFKIAALSLKKRALSSLKSGYLATLILLQTRKATLRCCMEASQPPRRN